MADGDIHGQLGIRDEPGVTRVRLSTFFVAESCPPSTGSGVGHCATHTLQISPGDLLPDPETRKTGIKYRFALAVLPAVFLTFESSARVGS